MLATVAPATTTLTGVLAHLETLQAADPYHYDAAPDQLQYAVQRYLETTGHDLSSTPLVLVEDYPVGKIDHGYNYTAAGSVAEYSARWVESGRLHGEDLDCQVDWYTQLVKAAKAGTLPPGLVHEVDGKAVIVDGGHRQSAHRSAGLATMTVYVARDTK